MPVPRKKYPVIRSFFRSLWRVAWQALTGNVVLLPFDDATVLQRRGTCAKCPHRHVFAGTDTSYCKACKCVLNVKQRIVTESCPNNYWKK